jgi:hypothetical protein
MHDNLCRYSKAEGISTHLEPELRVEAMKNLGDLELGFAWGNKEGSFGG